MGNEEMIERLLKGGEKLLKDFECIGWGPGPFYEHNQEVFAAEDKEKRFREKFKSPDFQKIASDRANNMERTADYQFATKQIGLEEHQREIAGAKNTRYVNSPEWLEPPLDVASNIEHQADSDYSNSRINFETYQRELAKSRNIRRI
ncbi:MAG: hypothetical protein KJ906_04375 [Nanoarchaeota archaeon]|nr:hypothetical protein [Nanoarchaeota archaeon]